MNRTRTLVIPESRAVPAAPLPPPPAKPSAAGATATAAPPSAKAAATAAGGAPDTRAPAGADVDAAAELELDEVLGGEDAEGEGADDAAGEGAEADEGAEAGEGADGATKTKPDPLAALRDLADDDRKPEWLQALEHELEASGRSFFELKPEDIAGLDIAAKRVLANLVIAQRQAKDQVADADQQRRQREDAATAAERRAQAHRAKTWSLGQHKLLQEFVESLRPQGEQPDPYSPEGVKWAVQQQTHEAFSQFLAKFKEAADAESQAIEQAESKAREEAQVQELAAYMDQHAEDFDNPVIYERIEKLVKRTEGKITPQEAHQIVMAQFAAEGNEQATAQARERARRRLRPGQGRMKGPPPTPKFADEQERIEWYSRHPGALERDYQDLTRRGTSY